MTLVLAVALGGMIGAPARFGLDRFVADRLESELPFGTFLVNVSGSFVLGLVTGLAMSAHLSGVLRAFVGTGFCGAYTTFSTWSYETVRLVEEGNAMEAFANVAFGLVVGLAAAGAGIAVGLLG